jgi:Flp pilus assembly protein TadB
MVLAGIALGTFLSIGAVLAGAWWIGWHPPSVPQMWLDKSRANWQRAAQSAAVALAVAVLTRWPIAALTAGGITYAWPKLFSTGGEGKLHVARLEAIATWTESLRDTIAAAVGLEQAILASVDNSPDPIKPQLQRLAGRLRSHLPLPQSLSAFAEDFDDGSVDLVVAALVMNSRLRGSGLVSTLSALVVTARSELEMRTRVEEARKNLRRNARTIIGVTLVFSCGLMVLSRDYLSPYGTVSGQLALCVVVGLLVAGLWWIQSASEVEPVPRFLAGPQQLHESDGIRP